MASKVRSVAVGSAYALGGGVLLGGVGIVIGIGLAPDDGLQGLFNAVVGGVVGAVVGGILGVVVFVAGGKALERQTETTERAQARGRNDE